MDELLLEEENMIDWWKEALGINTFLKWWRSRRKWRKCNHFLQRGIYGDEINATGGLRAQCLRCDRFLAELPTLDKFVVFDDIYAFDEEEGPKKLFFEPDDLVAGKTYAFKYGQERKFGKHVTLPKGDPRWGVFEVEGEGIFVVPLGNVFAVWVDKSDFPHELRES